MSDEAVFHLERRKKDISSLKTKQQQTNKNNESPHPKVKESKIK